MSPLFDRIWRHAWSIRSQQSTLRPAEPSSLTAEPLGWRFSRILVREVLVCVLVLLLVPVETSSAQDGLSQAKTDVERLTGPDFLGRGYTFAGHSRAARFLRERMKEIGLKAPGDNFFQSFEMEVDLFRQAPSLRVNGRSLKLGTEYLPHPGSHAGTSDTTLETLSAGYGLVKEGAGMNAYHNLDVAGRAVVITEGVPDTLNAGNWPRRKKIEQAAARGARAVIIRVNHLTYWCAHHDLSIPVFLVADAAWPDIPTSISFGVAPIRDTTVTTQNVMGLVRGTSVPDSLLIVSAHYDHLGSIGSAAYFPGANDNAAGTAMILRLAEAIKDNPLRYSVLFVAFSGEECGLRGSAHFAKNPPVPLDRARFILNLDMIASGNEGVMAVGGADFTRYFRILTQTGQAINVGPIGKRPNVPNSDHFFIVQRGVPGFFLYAQGGDQPYHHVDDRASTLEWDRFKDVYRLSLEFLRRIGS